MTEAPDTTPAPPTSGTRGKLPVGTCDCHSHIFGPFTQFPIVHEPVYILPDAPKHAHEKFRTDLGVDRAILVQPAPYGTDPSAILDAIAKGNGQLRGVAVGDASLSDETLMSWKKQGIEGLRFTQIKTPTGKSYTGSVSFEELLKFGARLKTTGLHAELWGTMADLLIWIPKLSTLGIPLVLNHLGVPDLNVGVNSADFRKFISLITDHDVWVKLSACRVGSHEENYAEALPYQEAYVKAIPNRLIWGSDWPYIRKEPVPDAGKMLDLFTGWVDDPYLVEQILVKNPEKLYNFKKNL